MNLIYLIIIVLFVSIITLFIFYNDYFKYLFLYQNQFALQKIKLIKNKLDLKTLKTEDNNFKQLPEDIKNIYNKVMFKLDLPIYEVFINEKNRVYYFLILCLKNINKTNNVEPIYEIIKDINHPNIKFIIFTNSAQEAKKFSSLSCKNILLFS